MALLKMKAMQGSEGEWSYAENSWFQNYNFHSAGKPRLGEAIKHLVGSHGALQQQQAAGGASPAERPRHFAIADLGCSFGRNTLDCAEFVLRALRQTCGSSLEDVDILYFFSDLPSNDFNALFQSLQPYLRQSAVAAEHTSDAEALPKIFAAGVPGSFYGRLFPTASLDLVICSYSLHWLSQLPPSILDRNSPAWNGAHTWIHKQKDVQDAYYAQSQIDVKNFLKSRVHELRKGGTLFLVLIGSSPDIDSTTGSCHTTYEVLDSAWKELVDERTITLEEMEMYNHPAYFFNQQELECALKEVPEFKVSHMETIKNMAVFPDRGDEGDEMDEMKTIEQWLRLQASTTKPMVEAYMGKTKADNFFEKLRTIGAKHRDIFRPGLSHDLVIASLLRV